MVGAMRGPDEQTQPSCLVTSSPEQRVRADHPLRRRSRVDRRGAGRPVAALSTTLYSEMGRPSIPPEQLLRALLLQVALHGAERAAADGEIDYSMLFRWFVGLGMDDEIWSPTTFSKNRDRLL